MTRKRFVKLLMARGYSRNEANKRAWDVVYDGGSYDRAYAEIVVACSLLDAIPDFVANVSSAIESFAAVLPKFVQSISRFVDACIKATATSNRALLEETLQDRQT